LPKGIEYSPGMSPSFQQELERASVDHDRLLRRFVAAEGTRLELACDWARRTLLAGGKLLLFGNGGSAAHAQHLAAEFTNRLRRRRRALAALALTTDGAVLTSIANDDSFTEVFARQLEALGTAGDLAVAISTSGDSANVVAGLRRARALGLKSVALLGGSGGAAAAAADLALIVPGADVPRIQEVQLLAAHVLCDRVEAQWVTATASGSAAASERRREPRART
jgi:D-sedoheptulose 7-phosphate isomerase